MQKISLEELQKALSEPTDDYTEEIATAIIRERDGLGVDAFDKLLKLYF